ncbi:alpha/beta fold hydrolase [Streptomyces sp. NPDC059076]|uniref:alpha/beta fold hydrolase n=1 Tax=unclassified Streptomyces TaxID=2593676 RepID=UPI0036A5B232
MDDPRRPALTPQRRTAKAEPRTRRCPRLAVTGAHDLFLPPQRLRRAVRDNLGTELQVITHTVHLLVEEHPELLANLASANPSSAKEGTSDGDAGTAR